MVRFRMAALRLLAVVLLGSLLTLPAAAKPKPVPVSSITLFCSVSWRSPQSSVVTNKTIEFNDTDIKKTISFGAMLNPAAASDKRIAWSSSNPSVATINAGMTTIVGVGTTEITVRSLSGSKKASCRVVVKEVFGWPVPSSGLITSGYGMRDGKLHDGIDISAAKGSLVVASRSGTVKRIKSDSISGNYLIIEHPDGWLTYYGHLKGYATGLAEGSKVNKGMTIAYVGNTGSVIAIKGDGSHLHFYIQDASGNKVDPLKYVSAPKK